MRNLRQLDHFRIDMSVYYGWLGDETCGAFTMPSPIDGQPLMIVASCGDGWDHLSVSRRTRCPNWPEMEFVKQRFFEDTETAMQLHVPTADHINNHAYTLHIWRPHHAEIPRPPAAMVGIKEPA